MLEQEGEELLLLLCQVLEQRGVDLLHLAHQLPHGSPLLLALCQHGCANDLRQLLQEAFLSSAARSLIIRSPKHARVCVCRRLQLGTAERGECVDWTF